MNFCRVCYGTGEILGAGMIKMPCDACRTNKDPLPLKQEAEAVSPPVNVFKRRGRPSQKNPK